MRQTLLLNMLINANDSKCRKLTTKNFSLNLELILAFASTTNLKREVKMSSRFQTNSTTMFYLIKKSSLDR